MNNLGPLSWVVVVAGAIIVLFIAQMVHLSIVLAWSDQKTRGLGYFGLPPAGRRRFRKKLKTHARLLFPILRIVGRPSESLDRASFTYRGVAGPKGTCNEESFARAHDYEATHEDVFVVTQMKCGTTWMQHVVYEALHRGDGDLVDSGTALYAVSPWLEAVKSVSVEDAPLVGAERPSRVIKTHMPAELCPFDPAARYVYVSRHPASCFASCVDFLATNMGAFAPRLETVEAWFCSDETMWWRSWPTHVRSWWELSERHDNVLFVRFEDMKADLATVARRVANFLGMRSLKDRELERVLHKCSFAYMQEHRDAFEMHPPHLLAIDAELFVKGTADRHRDVPEEPRWRIMEWCTERMADGPIALDELYGSAASDSDHGAPDAE